MFFSRLWVDSTRRGARRLLASPQRVHAVVAAATGPGRDRPLWRLDDGTSGLQLMVVSRNRPDFTSLLEQCGMEPEDGWQTAEYGPFLERLAPGQRWHFRLTANPVKSVRQVDGAGALPRGKRIPLRGVRALSDWALSRSNDWGIELSPDEFAVTEVRADSFRRSDPTVGGRHRISINSARFEGNMTVNDPDRLRHALVSGIGSAKAYGCGLLTLAPL